MNGIYEGQQMVFDFIGSMSNQFRATDTRNESYVKTREHLGEMQVKILRAVKELGGKATNIMISSYLNLPINRVTGRVKELRELGYLREYKQVLNPDGNRKIWMWAVIN